MIIVLIWVPFSSPEKESVKNGDSSELKKNTDDRSVERHRSKSVEDKANNFRFVG